MTPFTGYPTGDEAIDTHTMALALYEALADENTNLNATVANWNYYQQWNPRQILLGAHVTLTMQPLTAAATAKLLALPEYLARRDNEQRGRNPTILKNLTDEYTAVLNYELPTEVIEHESRVPGMTVGEYLASVGAVGFYSDRHPWDYGVFVKDDGGLIRVDGPSAEPVPPPVVRTAEDGTPVRDLGEVVVTIPHSAPGSPTSSALPWLLLLAAALLWPRKK